MAGPQILGGGGDKGPAAIQAGITSIQQLGTFLEQRRQFEEEQARLDRMTAANWGWGMLKELVNMTPAKSFKDVFRLYPDLAASVMSKAFNTDKGSVLPWITAIAQSPYNDVELMNDAFTTHNQFGSGEIETGEAAIKTAIAKLVQPGEKAGAVPTGEGAAPAIAAPTTVPKGMEPGQLDPSGVLEALKKELYATMKQQEKEGFAVGAGGILPTKRVVDKYRVENPTYSEAITKWERENMSGFLRDVEEGRWEPGMAQTGPRPTSAAPGDRVQRERERQAEKSDVIELKMKPVVVTAKAPENPKLEPTMADFISSLQEDQGAGQVALKRKKFQAELTSEMSARMKRTPEGRQTLIENANWLIHDPDSLRAMAMSQNAASVYATDLEARGGTQQSKMALAKSMLELEKLGLEVEKARIALAREGIAGAEDQNKLIMSSAVVSMMQDGTVVPPAVSDQAGRLLTQMEDSRKIFEVAKAKGDEATTRSALTEYKRLRDQWAGIMVSLAKAMKATDSPNAQKYAKLLESTLTLEPSTFLGFWKKIQTWGLVEKGSAESAAKPVEIPQDEKDFNKAAGLE